MSATFMCMAAQKKEVVIHPSEQTSTTGGRKYPRTPVYDRGQTPSMSDKEIDYFAHPSFINK